MVVMILKSVPVTLRGELSRWLIEAHPGVFVGHVNARVRDRLWEKCCTKMNGGGVIQLWSTNTEQKFQMRAMGETGREIIDLDGLQLIRLPSDDKTSTADSIKISILLQFLRLPSNAFCGKDIGNLSPEAYNGNPCPGNLVRLFVAL